MNEAIFAAYALILAGAAGEDLWRLRISNIFPVALVALFVIAITIMGAPRDIWQNGIGFLAMLAVGLLLFAQKWLGGGDVKLMAATALWFNFAGLWKLIFWVTVTGALLAIILIISRRLFLRAKTNTGESHPVMVAKGPIPYGMAIAAGGIVAALQGATNPAIMPW